MNFLSDLGIINTDFNKSLQLLLLSDFIIVINFELMHNMIWYHDFK